LRATNPDAAAWRLSLGGTEVQLVKLPGGILSGDISSHAGVVRTLRLQIDAYEQEVAGAKLRTNSTFDSIRFSPLEFTETPEPAGATLAVLALGAALMRRTRGRAQ
jgi:hypothetical protein